MKSKWPLYTFSLLSISLFSLLQIFNPPIIDERVEALMLDYRFLIRNLIKKPEIPKDILIVAIDEKSLTLFGRWPWDRGLQAKLINKILLQEPKVLAVDILYPERQDIKNDSALSEVFHAWKNRIVLALAPEVPEGINKKEIANVSPAPDYVADSSFSKVMDLKLMNAISANQILPPIQELGEDLVLGHVYNRKDMDGKTRWETLYLKYDEDFYPSFSLQTARVALGVPQDKMILYAGRGIGLDERFIPFDPYGGKLLVNYLGKEGTFTYISASDFLLDNVSSDLLKGKIVFLGTSAVATYDLINTPLSANMPGVEKNATVAENILNQHFLRRSYGIIEIFVILVTGLFFGFFIPRLKAFKASIIASSTVFFYLVFLLSLFIYKGIWANMTYPIANMLLIFTGITVTKYLYEEKLAKDTRILFSSYVSPKIVEELLSTPDKLRLGGERKTITVLFSDIRGFTALSEGQSPEQVVATLNEYFSEMADIIFRWDGTLDKFVGDSIFAFWGAPVDQPDHAELAVRCALNMSDRLSKLQEKWRTEGKTVLECGIGINSGEVVIGNIGALRKKMDYTAIGDPVNLGSRVESLTKEYNIRIMITEFTLEYLKPLIENKSFGHLEFTEIGSVMVKGKKREVRVFGLKSHSDDTHKYDSPS